MISAGKRRLSSRAVLGLTVAGVAAGFYLGLPFLPRDPNTVARGLFSIALSAAGVFGGAIAYFRQDEAEREASKSAAFWGGCIGACAAVAVMIALQWPGVHLVTRGVNGRSDPAAFMGWGVILVLGVQAVAIVVARAVWWRSKR